MDTTENAENHDEESRPRPSKKLKTTNAPISKKTGRKKKSLDLLPTMPLDILYEVLGQLHPRDLVNLSKANRLFRETLTSDGMRVVWKRVLDDYEAPACPRDMKEYAWVEFLFVPLCEICGKKNTHIADFLIRRRLCTGCRKSNIVLLSKIKKELSKEVLDHLPFSTAASATFEMRGDPEKRSARRYFFIPDILPMITKLEALNQLARCSSEEQRNFNAYKDSKKKAIQEMQSSVGMNQKWLLGLFNKRHDDDHLRYERRFAIKSQRSRDIKAKLTELGYSKEDISIVRFHAELDRAIPLSDSIWKRVRPILENLIQDTHEKRARQLRESVLIARRTMVESIYNTYRESLPPTEWKYLPRVFDLCNMAPFVSLINAPSETKVVADDFEPAKNQLSDILRQYKESRLETFRSQAIASSPDFPVGDTARNQDHPVVNVLDLAVTVFQCSATRSIPHLETFPVIGVEDILSHHCDLHRQGLTNPRKYGQNRRWYMLSYSGLAENSQTFSCLGSRVARILVGLAGLDPQSALAVDMDKLDLRFYCDKCRQKNGTEKTKYAFSWREAIRHAFTFYLHKQVDEEEEMALNIFSVVPEIEAAQIKESEMTEAAWEASAWSCGHCTTFGDDFQSREAIVEHVQTQHAVPIPKQFQDFIVLDRTDPRYFTHHFAIQA